MTFDDLWPSDMWAVNLQDPVISHGKDAIKSSQICGKEVPRGYWVRKK